MTLTGAVVMYAVFWFIALLLILPHGQSTQLEEGEVEPGTPGSAPSEINIRRKFLYASIVAAVALAVMAGVLESGVFQLNDFSFLFPESFNEPPAGRG